MERKDLDKALALRPDLILMDLRLPVIDGWELVHRLKADQRTRNCAVVIVTGLTWLQPKSLECNAWFAKPCPLERLEAEVATVLRNPRLLPTVSRKAASVAQIFKNSFLRYIQNNTSQ